MGTTLSRVIKELSGGELRTTMSISIGPIVLEDFEIPNAVSYGGGQRIITHYLGDGRRVLDILGPEEADIRFTGIITGPDASLKVHRLDELRRRGLPTNLRWGGFDMPVFIREFHSEYRTPSWIHYSASFTVIDHPHTQDTIVPIINSGDLERRLTYLQNALAINLPSVVEMIHTLADIFERRAPSDPVPGVPEQISRAISQLIDICAVIEERIHYSSTVDNSSASSPDVTDLIRLSSFARSILVSLRAALVLTQRSL